MSSVATSGVAAAALRVGPPLTPAIHSQMGSDCFQDECQGQQAVPAKMAKLPQCRSEAGGLVDRGGAGPVAPFGTNPRRARPDPRRFRTAWLLAILNSVSSAAQDELLLEGHRKVGNRWTEIAKMVQGRTDNAVKNRFAVLVKKQARAGPPPPAGVVSFCSSDGQASPPVQAKPDKNRGKKRARVDRDGEGAVQTPPQASDRNTPG